MGLIPLTEIIDEIINKWILPVQIRICKEMYIQIEQVILNLARNAIEQARSKDHLIGFIFLDLDHFKRINDTFGHPCGDHVLKVLATAIEGAVRTSDFVLRYGGEEFLVVLPGASLKDGHDILNRIRRQVLDNGPRQLGELKCRHEEETE